MQETNDESKYQKRSKRTLHQRKQILGIAFCVVIVVGGIGFAFRSITLSFQKQRELKEQQQSKRAKIIQQLRNSSLPSQKQMDIRKGGRKIAISLKARNEGDRDADIQKLLDQEIDQLDADIRSNHHGGIRWIRTSVLKELPGKPKNPALTLFRKKFKKFYMPKAFAVKRRREGPMAWENDWKKVTKQEAKGPKVDYRKIDYTYPDLLWDVPDQGGYPQLDTLGDIMKRYPQDDLDNPPQPFVEKLLHFNYSNPKERAAAVLFRDAELPFKVYDVPDLPTQKWTDKYVSEQFDGFLRFSSASGLAQESPNNFFAFFTQSEWHLEDMGPPPTRNNDWTYKKWSDHARYADHVGLDFDQPHFYWQAGAPKMERYEPKAKWSFISKDLPLLSSPTATFFVFEPDEQKGIQCRFGERGVTAATHYDSGRNMVAMILGAKRYILAPPRECSKLGIVSERGNAIFRHSLLNFGHINHLNTKSGISDEERSWLELASRSKAIDTILKEGEVLYIPSHWFHYITSVQKSAQCNVRSGIETEGTKEFGGFEDVKECTERDGEQ